MNESVRAINQGQVAQATTIILCAGAINYIDLPVASNRSNAMIPVSGKPVIAWILDDLLAKGISRCTLVLRAENDHLRSFVARAYGRRMEVSLVGTRSQTINESLAAGLTATPPDGAVRIVLGDTLIRDPFEVDDDFIYVVDVEASRKWCVVHTGLDQRVTDYVDKVATAATSQLGVAGVYCLTDGALLSRCVQASVEQGDRELSQVLRRYGAARPIGVRHAMQWFDFGHIEALVDARHRLISPRYFNSMRVDPLLKTITKASENDAKLRDERDWYNALPERLRVLSPRILAEREVDGRLEVTQEYYGYPTLAELYLYGDLQLDTWSSIIRYVLTIHGELRKERGSIDRDDVRYMYETKVEERLAILSDQDSSWQHLLSARSVRLNGEELRNWPDLRETVRSRAKELAASSELSVVHGDLCFSNVLFDINNQILRLIDPRGSFRRKGIYGDPRYDVAKLRHSACGFYDYLVSDMFSVERTGNDFGLEIHLNETAAGLPREFDRLVDSAGWDLREIRLIESLLFISMVPLHRDHPRRQLAMYLTGLKLLNDVTAASS